MAKHHSGEVAIEPADWLVWEARDHLWWRPGGNGYTRYLHEAGRFTEAQATRHQMSSDLTSDRRDIAMPLSALAAPANLCAEWSRTGHTCQEMIGVVRRSQELLAENHALKQAAPAPPAQAWQPIETAPNEDVLLYRPGLNPRDRVASRRVSDWCGESCCPSAKPTHWMPLPEAP